MFGEAGTGRLARETMLFSAGLGRVDVSGEWRDAGGPRTRFETFQALIIGVVVAGIGILNFPRGSGRGIQGARSLIDHPLPCPSPRNGSTTCIPS